MNLTPREHQIAALVAQGKQNKAIAHELGLTHPSIKTMMYNLIHKLGVSNRVGLAMYYVSLPSRTPESAPQKSSPSNPINSDTMTSMKHKYYVRLTLEESDEITPSPVNFRSEKLDELLATFPDKTSAQITFGNLKPLLEGLGTGAI